MQKILLVATLLLALIQLAYSFDAPAFLQEEAAADHVTEGAEHEEGGGGIELHYSYGTRGFYICVGMALLCTGCAGLMSGLTVGLLSIDTLELEMKLLHGTDEQKKLAAKVLPLLKKHHYLLVTLLLCNAVAMEALPIFLDAVVPAFWAIIISVTWILFFGEIIPQAFCTGPQQLKIASVVTPSVNFLMISVGIIAYPISKFLDFILGEHHAIRYTNHDLKALIELHSYHALQETLEHPEVRGGFGLQAYQTKMIQGAIDIQGYKVKDIMIPFERLYSIRIGKKIDLKSAKKIQKHGHSRIPVYMNKDRHAIIGYLLIKTLVGVDLSEGKTISQLMTDSIVTLRRPLYISPSEGIGGLMTRFKNGKSHMAIVTDNIPLMEKNMQKYLNDDGSVIDDGAEQVNDVKQPKVLGIVTLEDVIESALKEDILDEADYDIENDPNFRYKMDRSDVMSMIDVQPTSKPKVNQNLHKVIQMKVNRMLTRKQSDPGYLVGDDGNVELNELSKDKMVGQNFNQQLLSKQERLKNQMLDPEMSKSYSFAKNKNNF